MIKEKNLIWVNINYIIHKLLEKLLTKFTVIFDEKWYQKQYPDVVLSGQNPLKHWIYFGISESRDPTNYMFTQYYRSQLRHTGILFKLNPTIHYLILGKKKNLSPHPIFDNNRTIKEKPLRELKNIDLDQGILRTPNRINVSPSLSHFSSLFHKTDIYVSNVHREGEVTLIKENEYKNLDLEIYRLEKYTLQRVFSKAMNSLNLIIPPGIVFTKRKMEFNSKNFKANSIFFKQLQHFEQKQIKDNLLSTEQYEYLLTNWFPLLDLDKFDSNNVFLTFFIDHFNKAFKSSKFLNFKEYTNLYIIRNTLLNYFGIYNPFINNLDSKQIIHNTRISIIISTKRPKFLKQFLEFMSNQTFKNYEILIALHGMSELDTQSSELLIKKFADEYNFEYRIWNFTSDSIISEILNTLIVNCKYELITKLDDDDLYGENHLLDLVVYAVYTNADFLGKSPMFIYHEATKKLYFDNQQYKYFDDSDEISGSSMIFKKSEVLNLGGVPLCVKNPDYVLRQLFKNKKRKIFRIYGFNHIIYRSNKNSHRHTWHDPNLLNEKISLMTISIEALIDTQNFWKI